MAGLGRYWRTLRHLKLRQFTGRAVFRLARPRVDLSPAPPRRAHDPSAWVLPARREASWLGHDRFRFIGIDGDLTQGWDSPASPKLWRYNLHYFDDLNAKDADLRRPVHRAGVQRWIDENPPAAGTGWEPYPVSLRIVNWVKWWRGGATPEPGWEHSLAVQARWLSQRLEVHLLGNHLYANAKALAFAGLYFDGPEADGWFARAARILDAETREQVLPDGGHFERSPMYHALALEDALDLVNAIEACPLSGRPAGAGGLLAQLRAQVQPMRRWLELMTHPDDTLALFNDAADGIAPATADLHRVAGALRFGPAPVPPVEQLVHLDPSGYVRVSRGPVTAMLDVAPIGPDYLPGHAHADTLSFELSCHGARVVVNGGTSQYGDGPERQRERGTAAHSTVQVAGQDSSEVWAGFRVGRRARPVGLAIDVTGETWEVACAHTGYRHLPGRPIHRRTWAVGAHDLTVTDEVSAPALSAIARYVLAPGIEVRINDGQAFLTRSSRPIALVTVPHGRLDVEQGLHAPRFGVREPVTVLAVHLLQGRAVARWSWEPHAHPLSD